MGPREKESPMPRSQTAQALTLVTATPSPHLKTRLKATPTGSNGQQGRGGEQVEAGEDQGVKEMT